MSPSAKRARDAAARSASLDAARAAAGVRRGPGDARAAGATEPLLGEVRRAGVLSLLVLHFCAVEPCYGNQLMERISALTAGALAVNPNTMYPLLRSLEARGLIAGEWEHPERRSRRFYRITEAGEAERGRLAAEVGPHLDRAAAAVKLIRRELGS